MKNQMSNLPIFFFFGWMYSDKLIDIADRFDSFHANLIARGKVKKESNLYLTL